MTVIMNIVADNMRLFRDNKHLSQKEVALSVGIPQGQYSRIENGKIEPSLSTLEKLTNFFGIPMAELFQTKDSLTNLMTEEASARYTSIPVVIIIANILIPKIAYIFVAIVAVG
jgi:transcriptional regulator with XRE-family HTH domain